MPTLRAGSGSGGTGPGTSTTISLTVPSGTVATDTICIWLAANTAGRTFSAPGYSPSAAPNPNSANMSAGLLTKTAVSGDLGGTVTVTCSGAALVFAGVIFATPTAFDPPTPDPGLIATATNEASGNNVTTTANGDLLVMPVACRAGAAGGTPATITPPGITAPVACSTVVSQLSTTSASAANIGVLLCNGTQSSAGTLSGSNAENATLSTNQACAAAFITLAGTPGSSGTGSLLSLFF